MTDSIDSTTGSTSRRIAFIGLGVMGAPMARHLAAAGHRVTVHNRTAAKAEAFADEGHGRAAATVAEAVTDAEVVITMLPDSPDVVAVLEGPEGVLAAAAPGTLLIDCSTISPVVTRELAERAADRGIEWLDAPVSGGEKGAIEATLSIMVGGADAAYDRARPVLDAVSRTLVHVGPVGAGQTVKAANQLLVAGHLQLAAEAMVFLRTQGVDLTAAQQVLTGGLAGSTVLQTKWGPMADGEFAPGFRIALHHKDLGILLTAAREAGVVLPLGAAAGELMASARARGDGDLDHSALLRGVELLSGQELSG